MPISNEPSARPPFRPTLRGCVGKDPRLCRMLEPAYGGELYAVAANTYRSLLCESVDVSLSAVFDRIAVCEAEHFRLLGELILCLGGNPALHVPLKLSPVEPPCRGHASESRSICRMLTEAIQEKRRTIERYQTLMGQTCDRVVRSLLVQLIADEEAHLGELRAVAAKQ